ncbi:Enoyl-[acyl-carrier-protein] reductase [NADH] [Austwickia chelonae]|uniref:Enoyl-[acyl-carrier-protein] reductase [NADH] n=1 Tax=Austwickia chelonae NBRC 105200 TaxID=1184607 RepID=K6ULP4_9MICO|nr:enoyl-ACP reductase FabI [Austwickia chelonae]GAB77426.1 enoyl-[acyl-carrier-protein] reductase [Austwickia chelonae NBRC 105200]SEW10193.1 Enoyl-[acyl-carrier-protein] reductase [NADH] [Austwickia chelonae]
MALLEGKKILVTGVLTESSIAFHVARLAQQEGAEVVLTSFGRAMKITTAIARRLPNPAPVVELDVSEQSHFDSLVDRLGAHVAGLDGVLHSIGFAPQAAFDFAAASWEDVAPALQISAFSLKSLVAACSPMMPAGGAVVGLTLDAKVAWPGYDWMGVAKAAFEATNRYCASSYGPQGIRCNLVAAGPIRTTAAKSIPAFARFAEWGEHAPLGWDMTDPTPTARSCVALLSDWFPATTGEIVHVDGGYHATGD